MTAFSTVHAVQTNVFGILAACILKIGY